MLGFLCIISCHLQTVTVFFLSQLILLFSSGCFASGFQNYIEYKWQEDFPDGPVVKTVSSVGGTSWSVSEVPHARWCSPKNSGKSGYPCFWSWRECFQFFTIWVCNWLWLSYMASGMLRSVPSMPSFWRVSIINGCWNLSDAFSAFLFVSETAAGHVLGILL